MAVAYGWAKEDILNTVYLDEALYYLDQIQRDKVANFQMQLAIVQNPNTKDPKALWNDLQRMGGLFDEPREDPVLDTASFDRMKNMMMSSSALRVV